MYDGRPEKSPGFICLTSDTESPANDNPPSFLSSLNSFFPRSLLLSACQCKGESQRGNLWSDNTSYSSFVQLLCDEDESAVAVTLQWKLASKTLAKVCSSSVRPRSFDYLSTVKHLEQQQLYDIYNCCLQGLLESKCLFDPMVSINAFYISMFTKENEKHNCMLFLLICCNWSINIHLSLSIKCLTANSREKQFSINCLSEKFYWE